MRSGCGRVGAHTGGVSPSERLLRLLSLLQARREWSGPELCERLGVSARTVRRDIRRLRDLGYPVHAGPGAGGGYGLEAGTAMPPLLLDDEEAVAIAVGLRTAAGTGAGGAVEGLGEAAVRALAKLEQVLPARLRRRVGALHAATTPLNGPPAGPRADPRTLTVLAAACRDREVLRFTYRGGDGRETRRAAEPHGLVPAARRWYLVAYDTGGRAGPGSGSRGGTGDGGGGWRSFRVDRLTCPRPTGVRFAPREVPGGDPAAFVARSRAGPEPVSAVLTVHASAGELADRFRVGDAEIEPVDGRTCVLRTTPDSLEWTALRIAYLDLDFEVEGPPELTARLTAMAGRLSRAARRRDGGA
ncbi:putative DNA-binding transcriptional regulator YafY [Actinomadura hallensis]|uniref:Putative DNA-binding transcriptional regulator YafY n=1 Tax=Actinomadura hallensis TaxID=337895 RepID=A0A543IFD9_9ACTN|nr:putative DNA-binding transcriptional regulator YafY [Actinomadura hallensis]